MPLWERKVLIVRDFANTLACRDRTPNSTRYNRVFCSMLTSETNYSQTHYPLCLPSDLYLYGVEGS